MSFELSYHFWCRERGDMSACTVINNIWFNRKKKCFIKHGPESTLALQITFSVINGSGPEPALRGRNMLLTIMPKKFWQSIATFHQVESFDRVYWNSDNLTSEEFTSEQNHQHPINLPLHSNPHSAGDQSMGQTLLVAIITVCKASSIRLRSKLYKESDQMTHESWSN